MKRLLIPNLLTVSCTPIISLVGCNDGANDVYKVSFESDGMLNITNTGGAFGQPFMAIISHADGYDDGNWIIPDNKIYYDVTIDGKTYGDFELIKLPGQTEFDYKIIFTIPAKDLGNDIKIKVKPYCKYLTFTTGDKPVSIYYKNDFIDLPRKLTYTTELNNIEPIDWTEWSENQRVSLEPHTSIYVWSDNTYFATGSGYDTQFNCDIFDPSSRVYCSGNIMSLINYGNMTNYCFSRLFFGSNFKDILMSGPVLPAETLSAGCYNEMFYDFDNSFDIILPCKDVPDNAYRLMFADSSINHIKVGFGQKGSVEWNDDATHKWLDRVAHSGTIIWRGSEEGPLERNVSTVPENWKIETW